MSHSRFHGTTVCRGRGRRRGPDSGVRYAHMPSDVGTSTQCRSEGRRSHRARDRSRRVRHPLAARSVRRRDDRAARAGRRGDSPPPGLGEPGLRPQDPGLPGDGDVAAEPRRSGADGARPVEGQRLGAFFDGAGEAASGAGAASPRRPAASPDPRAPQQCRRAQSPSLVRRSRGCRHPRNVRRRAVPLPSTTLQQFEDPPDQRAPPRARGRCRPPTEVAGRTATARRSRRSTVRTSTRCRPSHNPSAPVSRPRAASRARAVAFSPPVAARTPSAGREPPISQPMMATSTPSRRSTSAVCVIAPTSWP